MNDALLEFAVALEPQHPTLTLRSHATSSATDTETSSVSSSTSTLSHAYSDSTEEELAQYIGAHSVHDDPELAVSLAQELYELVSMKLMLWTMTMQCQGQDAEVVASAFEAAKSKLISDNNAGKTLLDVLNIGERLFVPPLEPSTLSSTEDHASVLVLESAASCSSSENEK